MQKIILWKEIDLLVCRKDVGIFFKSTFHEQAVHAIVKGVFPKRSDSCPDFLFFELNTSNFGYMLIF